MDEKESKEDKKLDQQVSKKFKLKRAEVWKYLAIFFAVLLAVSVVTNGFKGNIAGIGKDDAAEKAVEYINANLLRPGNTAELGSVEEFDNVYSLEITVGGQKYTSYVSKDGKMLFTSGVDMNAEVEEPEAQEQPEPEVQKSDKPSVELFVMSHCPFGTQAEKGMIPAVKALGDNIDFNLRFVYYAMHPTQGEVEEQLNQYCIQEEQNDKFLDYLECFLTEGDGPGCVKAIGIDEDKLASCAEKADEEFDITANLEDKSLWLNGRYPRFNTDKEANEKYGVGGSPTLIINGAKANSARDSVSYLNTICASFNDAPSECGTELSSASPSPGFGYETTSGATTTATCG